MSVILGSTSVSASDYQFSQQISPLDCTMSQVQSGSATQLELSPETCRPLSPSLDIKLDAARAPLQSLLTEQFDLLWGIAIGFAGLCALLLFYHKHDNVNKLDRKNKKRKAGKHE